jgi:acyl-CoA thioester hydrolase|nr:hypothetical protein [Aeromicrobium sp.]
MTAPTIDDLDQLGALLRREVPPEFEDFNGHVNVRHHYALHMDGAEVAFEDHLGIGREWIRRTGQSSFSVAQHMLFHHEILVGHEVSMHMRLLGASDKALHVLSVLANRTTGEVASTLEYVEVYVDLTTRRTMSMPAEIVAQIEPMMTRHAALMWVLPLSGRLGTSRRPDEAMA